MTALYPWLMPIYHQIAQTFDEGLGHHAVLIKADAWFRCRTFTHQAAALPVPSEALFPQSARMLNQPLFLAFPVGFLHTLSFIVLFLTFCQTDFHLDFSA